jgi:prepilin-type N-terminal cleavage/methylation domain-containing protein
VHLLSGASLRSAAGAYRAFTLVELLIAIGIVSALIGLATPLLSLSRRQAYGTNTLSIMNRVLAAAQQFKSDNRGLPYLEWSLTPTPPTASTTPPANLLAYRLARTMSDADIAALNTDLDIAAAAYEPGGSAYIASASWNQPRTQGWVDTTNLAAGSAVRLNILARRWATTNIMVGNVAVKKTVTGASGWTPTGSVLVAAPASRGYGDDYLGPWIPARCRVGDELCDAWGTPLLYLCPVQPGVRGYYPWGGADLINTEWFGFALRSLRSATTSLDSDLRNSALAQRVFGCELWSLGPDGVGSSSRVASTNIDNLPAEPYLRGLQ